jgi:hypothetical protein
MSRELSTNRFHVKPHVLNLLRLTVHYRAQFRRIIYFLDTTLV